MEIKPVTTKEESEIIIDLFGKYINEVNLNLDFQGFEDELKELPGKYDSPGGIIYLALIAQKPVGCIAVKPLFKNDSEMKRLYIKPDYRGMGISSKLTEYAINFAREYGYDNMYLDTLASMTPAIKLYKKHGFIETKPYYHNPLDNVVYMKLDLHR